MSTDVKSREERAIPVPREKELYKNKKDSLGKYLNKLRISACLETLSVKKLMGPFNLLRIVRCLAKSQNPLLTRINFNVIPHRNIVLFKQARVIRQNSKVMASPKGTLKYFIKCKKFNKSKMTGL